MRNITLYKNIGLLFSSVLLILVILLAILTHDSAGKPAPGSSVAWAVDHHTGIMIVMVLLAIAFGSLWSSIFYAELMKGRKDTRSILEMVFLFLGKEERSIIDHLLQQKGEANQADISRLPGMTRVKAHRSLQKMQEKRLVEIEAHGKVRKVQLKENIRNVLLDSKSGDT